VPVSVGHVDGGLQQSYVGRSLLAEVKADFDVTATDGDSDEVAVYGARQVAVYGTRLTLKQHQTAIRVRTKPNLVTISCLTALSKTSTLTVCNYINDCRRGTIVSFLHKIMLNGGMGERHEKWGLGMDVPPYWMIIGSIKMPGGLLPLIGEKVDVSVKITRFDNVFQCYKTFYAPDGVQAPLSPR